MDIREWIEHNTIFMGIGGSHAYGTNTPDSDIDYRGVCIPPVEALANLQVFEQADSGWELDDKVVFSIIKFVKLALDQTPNTIEMLFYPDDCIIATTPIWERLMEVRKYFLSKRIKYSYAGYADGQIRRMKSHRAWLLNPPSHEPTREEFGLDSKKINKSVMNMVDSLGDGAHDLLKDTGLEAAFWEKFEKEKKWRAAMKNWKQYKQWQANRNPARAAMEAKFGYDGKHALHCVRLLEQCLHVLRTGDLMVRLPADVAEFCLSIKAGALRYDDLMGMLTNHYLPAVETAFGNTSLPAKPNHQAVYSVVLDELDKHYSVEGWLANTLFGM